MQTDYIILQEYSQKTNLELSFFVQLEESGLIDIQLIEGERSFPASQLPELERYARMYYELSINIEGIDAIQHLLNKIEELKKDMDFLRRRLRLYE